MEEPKTRHKTELPDLRTAIFHGLMGRCPHCGKGPLFASYLKQVEHCAMCGEGFGHIRADDGPAWLTILIVGHVLAAILLWVIPNTHWTDAVSIVVWLSFTLLLALLVLPRAKGLFLAIIWRMGCSY